MTAAMAVTGGAESYVAECAERFSRSQIIAWLVQHHDSVAKATARRILRWDDLAQRLFHDGIRTLQGQAPSGPSLRVTWYRVRKLIAAQREKAKAAAEREALEQAEMQAQREAVREAAREEKARRDAETAANRRKFDEAQRAAQWAREREQKRAAEMPSAPVEKGAAVRIGQVAPVFKMLEAAPLYGDDARRPPPPLYVGPRPPGMPENLPLEALVSLEATGRKENGDYDFQNMPGLPRQSFFRDEYEWARCCLPMIRAIPPLERNMPLKSMFTWLRSFPGILSSIPGMK